MAEAIRQSEKAFHALGDPTRRIIFRKLQQGPLPVVTIAKGLTVSRPAVSQHLKVLREAKLISISQMGTRNLYKIDQNGVLAMRNYLDQFWEGALMNFKRLAEETEKTKKKKTKNK